MEKSHNSFAEKELLEKSVANGLKTIRKLYLEISLLSIEQEGLTTMASKITNFIQSNMPMSENFPLDEEDIFYKWSEQSSRYYAANREVHEIFLSKSKNISKFIEIVADEIQQLGMPMPDDIKEIAAKLVLK